MAWIQAAVTAAQLIGGFAANSKRQARKRMELMGLKNQLAPLSENVQRSRGLANSTQAPGVAELKASNRQAAADQVGAATRTAGDSSKISATVTRAGINQARGDAGATTMTDSFRERSEGRLANANMAMYQGERDMAIQKDQILMSAEKAKSNLIGAGANNLLTMARDNQMMKFYSKLYGQDYEDPMAKGFKDFGGKLKNLFSKNSIEEEDDGMNGFPL